MKQSTSKDNNGAYFSLYRTKRYCLWRIWDRKKPLLMFIGLNPSSADEKMNDPTIIRCMDFAVRVGYGGIYMLNLYPTISTDPKLMKPTSDKAMAINDSYLKFMGNKCKDVIFCWGNYKKIDPQRVRKVVDMFPRGLCLMLNKNGSPRHPLYVHSSVIPFPYE